MTESNNNARREAEAFANRLRRIDMADVKMHAFENIGNYTFDFGLIKMGRGSLFPSSVEADGRMNIVSATIRLPTVMTDGSEEKRVLFEDMFDTFAPIVKNIYDYEPAKGKSVEAEILIRSQIGNSPDDLTTHIEMNMPRRSGITNDKDTLIKLIREVKETWEQEYFHLDVLPSRGG